jgi:hemerythrin
VESYKWSERYNVGVDVIDSQHMSLMALLNECDEQVSRDKTACVDEVLLDRLAKYVSFHFKFEEDLMGSVGYKDLERHRGLHKYFVSRILELDVALSRGKPGQLSTVLVFLRDWFIHHVLGEDRAYVPFLKRPD